MIWNLLAPSLKGRRVSPFDNKSGSNLNTEKKVPKSSFYTWYFSCREVKLTATILSTYYLPGTVLGVVSWIPLSKLWDSNLFTDKETNSVNSNNLHKTIWDLKIDLSKTQMCAPLYCTAPQLLRKGVLPNQRPCRMECLRRMLHGSHSALPSSGYRCLRWSQKSWVAPLVGTSMRMSMGLPHMVRRLQEPNRVLAS